MSRKSNKNSNVGLNASQPDLTMGKQFEDKSGFPPGTTVDELWLYRRKKKSDDILQDQIQLDSGSFENIKSEYNKRFANYYKLDSSDENLSLKDLSPIRASKPADNLTLEGPYSVRSLYSDQFKAQPSSLPDRILPARTSFQFDTDNVENNNDSSNISMRKNYSETQSTFFKPEMIPRRRLKRRKSTLKLEGDHFRKTEQSEKFIEYLLSQPIRPPIARTSTTLKLEGDMETDTESRRQYIPRPYEPRPPLAKKNTNLHLEGALDSLTENLDKYIAFEYQKRPPLEKKSTNLHMEGSMTLEPEYRREFIPFHLERVLPNRPVHNLKIDGGFYDLDTENKTKFVSHGLHPQIPFLRASSPNFSLGSDEPTRFAEYKDKFVSHPRTTRSLPRRPNDYLRQQGDFDGATESRREYLGAAGRPAVLSKSRSNLQLEGQLDFKPEYKNSYVKYQFESPRSRRRTMSDESNLRNEGSLEMHPEYKSSYVDFPRKRPSVRKPTENIRYTGEMDHMSEKSSQFVKHPTTTRTEPMKREAELRLEGNFECQPEYRKAYIDYLIRERVERKPRPLDNMIVNQTGKRAFNINQTEGKVKTKIILPATSEESSVPVTDNEKVNSTSADKPPSKSLIPVFSSSSRSPSPSSHLKPPLPALRRSLKSPTPSKIPMSTSDSSSSPQQPSILRPTTTKKARSPRRTGLTVPKTVRTSRSPTPHKDRTGSRFSSPVRVDDLAYDPPTSPIPLNILYPRDRKQWSRSLSPPALKGEEQAFYVIENNLKNRPGEINNNVEATRFYGRENLCFERGRQPSLYREQKWMPSWNNSCS